jgi:hypothetical protein
MPSIGVNDEELLGSNTVIAPVRPRANLVEVDSGVLQTVRGEVGERMLGRTVAVGFTASACTVIGDRVQWQDREALRGAPCLGVMVSGMVESSKLYC